MLKTLALFVLALAVLPMQAYTLTHKTQEKAQSDQPTAPVPAIAAQQPRSQSVESETQAHVNADVRVVSTPPRDHYDVAAFWINFALAIAGFLGIGVGVGTLIFLRGQVAEMRQQRVLMKRTMNTMRRQTGILAESVEAAKETANAACGSVAFAEAQFELMKEKERARFDIDVGPIKVMEDDAGPFGWKLTATIKLRNIGASRAYIVQTAGNLAVMECDETSLPELDGLDFLSLPDGFLDPNAVPIEIDRWFFSLGSAGIEEFADDLLDAKKSIHLYGYIEYETLGFRWQKDFRFHWMTFGNLSALAIFGPSRVDPESAARRIAGGYWQPDPEAREHPIDSSPNNEDLN